MMRAQFEALSDSLNKAIRPFDSKLETIPIFPDQAELLPFLGMKPLAKSTPAPTQDPDKSRTGVDSVPVPNPDRSQAETGLKVKPNIFDDLKDNHH